MRNSCHGNGDETGMNSGADTSQELRLLPDILMCAAVSHPDDVALHFKEHQFSYGRLSKSVQALARVLLNCGPRTRTAVLLPNCPEAVIAAFATMLAGGIYVPVNPLLRPRQIEHVLKDSDATVLITTRYLYDAITAVHPSLPELGTVILTDMTDDDTAESPYCEILCWNSIKSDDSAEPDVPVPLLSPDDPALIFYTSGSTGRAKGVLVSHRNLLDGARIVSGYLANTADDRILAALPMSFDYGFSQITTGLYVGAAVVLTNYTMPQQLLAEMRDYHVTTLAGVPTMWSQLTTVAWPESVIKRLRYLTNSGGRIPSSVLTRIRTRAGDTPIFLMYGLTEAFRSTYLDPAQIDSRPNSIGKPVPEVRIDVVNAKGESCAPGEPGELVHSGALVSLGYWQNPVATAERFRPLPAALAEGDGNGMAVWSGDIVTRDEDGYLYFVDRADHMVKSSGYRISPAEVEEVIHASDLVEHAIAVGLPDERVGQRIAIAIVPKSAQEDYDFAIRHVCARELPPYMQPGEILIIDSLPLTAHGKPDRTAIRSLFDVDPLQD